MEHTAHVDPIQTHPDTSIHDRIIDFLNGYYFDTQSIPSFTRLTTVIDEAALARILTKLAVGSATVWWSLVELREIASLYRRTRKSRS